MKVLVVGSGGREHALCWKLRQSPLLTELYCAPANPGIAQLADPVRVPANEIHQLADFAAELGIDLTVVGPELPLLLGLADEFASRGLPVFGPRRQAAELEASKIFAKEFMKRYGIPTADFEIAHNAGDLRRAAKRFGFPVVLKADGLAAGRGVLITRDAEALEAHAATFFEERRFGTAGERIVIEEHLEGMEVSFTSLCDGERALPLASARDYRHLEDGDQGPQTAGMGAHSPAGFLGGGTGTEILESIVRPTVRAMAEENRSFVGVLSVGLMLTPSGPRVLEYNARLGDPEAQTIALRMEDDLLPVMASGAAGRFGSRLRFRKEAAACIVLASEGYPDRPATGEPITGIEAAAGQEGVEIFHSGTALKDGELVTADGRVLSVCAGGATLRDALKRAYTATTAIRWPSRILRRDIGRQVLTVPRSTPD